MTILSATVLFKSYRKIAVRTLFWWREYIVCSYFEIVHSLPTNCMSCTIVHTCVKTIFFLQNKNTPLMQVCLFRLYLRQSSIPRHQAGQYMTFFVSLLLLVAVAYVVIIVYVSLWTLFAGVVYHGLGFDTCAFCHAQRLICSIKNVIAIYLLIVHYAWIYVLWLASQRVCVDML